MREVFSRKILLYNEATGQHENADIFRGESAYEAAVRLGYTTLTEEQWVKEYDTKRDQAIAAINTKQTTALNEIEAKRESAIADADAAIDDIEQKGVETLASIPEDYTALTNEVVAGSHIIEASDLESGYWGYSTKINNPKRLRNINLIPVRAGMVVKYTNPTMRVYFGVLETPTSKTYLQTSGWLNSGAVDAEYAINNDGYMTFNAESTNDITPADFDSMVTIIGLPSAWSEVKRIDKDIAMLSDASVIVDTMQGTVCATDVASNASLQGLRVYGKTIQDGTPAPDAPVPLVSVGDSGSIAVRVATSAEDAEPQVLAMSTPNGLSGFLVTSGGNYTDADGQQWIADCRDWGRGVDVQRIGKIHLNGTQTITSFLARENSVRVTYRGYANAATAENQYKMSCNRLQQGAVYSQDIVGFVVAKDNTSACILSLPLSAGTTTEAVSAWIAAHPIDIRYIMETPIETPIPADELAAYRAMHTNKPNTTVRNDAGAWMQVDYAADIKLYIDDKFAELQNAILSQGANV